MLLRRAAVFDSGILFLDEIPRLYGAGTSRGSSSYYYRTRNHVASATAACMIYQQLLKRFPIISEQVDMGELGVILHALEIQLLDGREGAVVEFGCYVGTTSLFMRRLLDAYQFSGEFHVYDSFEGLPEKTTEDLSIMGEQFIAGELHATKKQLLMNFRKSNLTPPIIHKTWFSHVPEKSIPSDIMFAFLDGDYFESIRDSLALVTHRLVPGAVLIVDDYSNAALPGVALAVDQWRRDHPSTCRVQSSLAIIMPHFSRHY